jgi:hypothetical protein
MESILNALAFCESWKKDKEKKGGFGSNSVMAHDILGRCNMVAQVAKKDELLREQKKLAKAGRN